MYSEGIRATKGSWVMARTKKGVPFETFFPNIQGVSRVSANTYRGDRGGRDEK